MTAGGSARAMAARLAARHRARTIKTTISAGAAGAAAVGLLTSSLTGALLGGAVTAILGAATARTRPTHAGAWSKGAEGEEATAAILTPLALPGWTVLHDRAIPGTRANLDHLVVSPTGAVVVIDSKRWRRDWAVTATPDGRLMCGPRPQDRDVASIAFEANRVASTLRVPVHRIIAVHGAHIPAGPLRLRHPSGQITVTAAHALPALLRALPGGATTDPRLLAQRAELDFPPYNT